MKLVILGAGGVGSYLGALLARAGHNVLLVDRYRQHVEAINRAGLQVSGQETFTVGCPSTADVREAANFGPDLLISATKHFDQPSAIAAAKGLNIQWATSIANGLDVYEPLVDAFGRDKVLGMVTLISGTLIGPGHTRGYQVGRQTFVGELDAGSSPRIAAIAEALESAGLKVVIPDSVTAVRWTKMVWWIPLVVVPAVTRLTWGQTYCQRDLAVLFTHIERECAAVATQLGYPPRDYPGIQIAHRLAMDFDEAVDDVLAMGRQFVLDGQADYEVAMLIDLKKHRPTEVDATAGVIVQAAQQAGIAVPHLEFAWRAIRSIQAATIDKPHEN